VSRSRALLGGAVLVLAALAAAVGAEPDPVGTLTLPPSSRVIVFAPHPDDETIAAGGLLAQLARAGHPVRVVFFTNGDGYPEAVSALAGPSPTDRDYVAYGTRREREAVAALGRLGVARDAIRFLGFPDGGLAELWHAHWTQPYRSPFTARERPPYTEVVQPTARYDGTHLTHLVETELRAFHPTLVIVPHPADVHADHAHAGMFVIEAVAALEAKGALPARTTTLGYLVHYRDWPLRRGPSWNRVLPAPDLGNTSWVQIQLTAAAAGAKRRALAEYRSQLAMMRGYLQSFLTDNELFARIDPETVARIAAVH
jgi:LmbE family N-acetylglucosaminyl deacetylase